MSATPDEPSTSREQRVNEAIAAYFEARERGEAPDRARARVLAEYGDVAAELHSFFANLDHLRQVAGESARASNPQSRRPRSPAEKPTFDPDEPTQMFQERGDPSPEDIVCRFGAHELLHELARGGMGVIFKARDTSIGRDVAVKMLLEQHQAETELLQRFKEEAQISGQLQHPGVTPVYEMGQLPDQRPYFTMKLVKGETLSSLLRQRPDPTHERLRFLKIFEQVCQTLAYSHSRGVIHRDLKPANIMVGAFGEVQVMDWGLGKVLGAGGSKTDPSAVAPPTDVSVICTGGGSSQTRAGSVVGTVAYMPPEQAMGQVGSLDQRADVFGLGAILCEILTGQPPYTGSDRLQVQFKAVRAELTDAFDRLDRCGADVQLTRLARRALAAQPNERPADAGVMAAEVTAYLEGVETRLRQAELAEVQAETRAFEERRRRKQGLVLSGVALAVLAIGVIGTTWGLIQAGRALEAARREKYDSDVNVGSQKWESLYGTAKNVHDLLSRHMPDGGQSDLREFAWRLLWTELYKNSGILPGHDRGARLVAYASDKQLVTLDGELTLRHWELSKGNSLEPKIPLDARHVSCWAISPDAQWIALGAGDKVAVFDARTGKKMKPEHAGHALILALCFSADGGKLAAVWGDGEARSWDVDSGADSFRCQAIGRLTSLKRAALTTDGQSLVLIGYPEIDQVTWLGADGREWSVDLGHESAVYSVALTPNGQMGASGDSNGQVCLWNAATHERIGTGERIHRGKVMALQFSPDGKWLATGGAEGVVTVWDVTRWEDTWRQPLHSFKGHLGRIQELRFSPDGNSLASASDDGDVRVWDLVPSDQSRGIAWHERPVFSVAWSPGRQWLAVGTGSNFMVDDGIVELWDVQSDRFPDSEGSHRKIRAGKGRVLSLAFSKDGRTLVTGGYDSYLRAWDPDSGERLWAKEGLSSEDPEDKRIAIGTLAISPDGTLVAAGFGRPTFHQPDYNQVAKIYDLASGRELRTLNEHSNTICSVAFSRDGKLLATASDDQQVKLWSVGDWNCVRTLIGTAGIEAERFKSVVFSPDGKWVLAGGETGAISVWETTGDRRPVRQLTGHTNAVPCLVFSPDGRTLASASWDNTVKLWDPISSRETRTLHDHTDWISCLAFSFEGSKLATGSFDKTVRLYNADSAEEIAAKVSADHALTQRREMRQKQRAVAGTLRATAALLDQYAGRYEGGLTIEHRGGHLTIHPIRGVPGAAVAVYPEFEKEFVCRDRDLEVDVIFLTDEQERVSRVIVYRDGEVFEAKKQTSSDEVNPLEGKP
jgi:WD40 repeat protein/serine/threonine protein kinase